MNQYNYHVNVPQLDGLTDTQRNRAIENYMRESQRQLRMVLERINADCEKIRNEAAAAQKTADAAATPRDVTAAIAASEADASD